MAYNKNIIRDGFIRQVTFCLVSLAAGLSVWAADTNISTNWFISSSYTVADPNNNRVCMGGTISGPGRLIVNNASGIRFDKPNYDFTGNIDLQKGVLDPRVTMAFGHGGRVRIDPQDSSTPYINFGLYTTSSSVNSYTAAFTNDFEQVLEVAETDAETFSSASPTIQVAADSTKQHSHIHIVGATKFHGSAVLRVGQSASIYGTNHRLYFDGPVTVLGDKTLHLQTWGDFYFNDAVTARRLFLGNAWSQNCTVHLDSPTINVRQIELYAGCVDIGENCQTALPQLHWPWSWDSARSKLTLNGHDHSTPGLSFTARTSPLQRFFNATGSDTCSTTSGGPTISSSTPATLTITGGRYRYEAGESDGACTNYVAYVRFLDKVSLRVDAWTNAFTQTLRLLPSSTTGGLDVNRGRLRIEAPVTFSNLTSIRVGADGVLDTVLTNCPNVFGAVTNVAYRMAAEGYVTGMYASVTNLDVAGRFLMTDVAEADPLPSVKVLGLSSGARLEMTSDYTFRVNRFFYNGVEQAPGVYMPSELVRGGVVIVDDGAEATEVNWTGTNGNNSVQYGFNWQGYAQQPPDLMTGVTKPYFSVAGTNVVFDMPTLFNAITLKAPGKQGVTLYKERGVGGRAARIGLMGGGLAAKDGTSSTTANKRRHVIEPPLSAYQSQTWSLDTASTVVLDNGFSDGGAHGVTIQKTGKGTLILDGTNAISSGSAFVVPYGSANQGYVGITGTVHVAGAFAVSNGAVTVSGRLAGPNGKINLAAPVPNADGTLSFRQGGSGVSAPNRFTLDGAQLDLPVWLLPYTSSGTSFYLTPGSENYVRGPLVLQAPTKGNTLTLNTQGATITFEDQIIATNCIWKTQYKDGHVVLENRRFAENGGNRFYIYSPTAGLTEFNTPYNTFMEPDNGGLTFDYNNGTAQFNVDLAVTNGTFRFNNTSEKNVYRSYCNLMSTSQRIDRLVGVRAASGTTRTNFATLYGDGAWLEIAGNGLASTNGLVISNCVNIAKTGSADLLFYDHDLVHTGELNILNGRVIFDTNATWRTAQVIHVTGPGCLKLNASERFSNRVRLHLDNLYAEPAFVEDPPELLKTWTLELPAGVTQSVAALVIDGAFARPGLWGNTNFNASVTCHDDRIQGAGVLKVAQRSLVLRFR